MKVKRVTRITLETPAPVYDITVPETENFCLGNGAVVHNSKDLADAACGVYMNMMKLHVKGELYNIGKHAMRGLYSGKRH